MIGEARAQYFAWRGAAFAIPAVPSPVDPFLARALGGLAYAAAARARAAVRDNLGVIAPALGRSEREALVRRAFANQARNYLATLRLPSLDVSEAGRSLDLAGWENVEAARSAGRGIIFASAHFGPVALVGPVALAARDLSIAVIAEDIPPKLFELLNRHLRGAHGTSFLPASQTMQITRTLKRGGAIGVLADRPVTRVGLRVPFFGREALLPVGHLALAARTGSALLPSFALPGPRGEILPALELRPERGEAAQRENLTRWVAILERVIASAPDEWHVFERFWP